ncbi:uncharacterized protein NECHADRAFT_87218 [Fusarium vanettenii 77-13-4]|uniref:Uncharacterized protein n=1 Tax=Fusarium vanettenii (strain ATCC MYA-4622 / CBS 123669 / FGSC 9596 / NRRL 45880 / 77-13-4) TaxID=660122 RepID=C7ZIP7_FUSV7|nr:uncharacterized protein NECHADRAFT_87218 [Fusarium vanettenii 77-13-4]EEU36124.1 predicted protein [Fusarium vanettenii 77-13-4]
MARSCAPPDGYLQMVKGQHENSRVEIVLFCFLLILHLLAVPLLEYDPTDISPNPCLSLLGRQVGISDALHVPEQANSFSVYTHPFTRAPVIMGTSPAFHQQRVSNHLKMDMDKLKAIFPSDSKYFWKELSLLSNEHRDWHTVSEALNEAQNRRCQEKRRGVSTARKWLPQDAKEAKRVLDAGSTFVLPLHINEKPKPGVTGSPPLADELPAPVKPSTHILWCGVPTVKDMSVHGESALISLPVASVAVKASNPDSHLRCFSEERLEVLEQTLGRGFVSTDQEGCAIVHQDLATVLCAEHTGIVTAELHNWNWFRQMLTTGELKDHVEAIEADQVVIFVAYTGAEWTENGLEQFYRDMEPLCAILPHLRLYPSHDEFMAVNLKFPDIAAMDRIAKTAPPLQPEPEKDEPRARWFHMEYVPTFKTVGEYRVHLCGDNAVSIGISKFVRDKLEVRSVSDDDFAWFSKSQEEQQKKRQELCDFARYQRKKLLEQPNADKAFESLRVGVRIDIGVSEESPEGRFFGLELTRWWNANHMPAFVLPDPYTEASLKYGRALAMELTGRR